MAEIKTTSLGADGKPIAQVVVIDKESGTETPVNVSTCAEAVTCSRGMTMEDHLANLYGHTQGEGAHLTAEQKANLETKTGAQEKATDAKNAAIATAALLVESAKTYAAADATEKATAARDAAYKHTNDLAKVVGNHTADNSNPHGVTAAQVGLGNVPNKSTNNQQPTYEPSSALEELVSGETMGTAFGKIAKAIVEFISHFGNKSNPHSVTASQVGAIPKSGGTMSGALTVKGLKLTEGIDYGTSLPASGTKGQIFFLQD